MRKVKLNSPSQPFKLFLKLIISSFIKFHLIHTIYLSPAYFELPSVTRSNFDDFIKNKNLTYIPKMEVVSHNLLVNLIENDFGIGLVTKEFIKEKLNKTLYEIKIPDKIPKRKLGYAIKEDTYPTFTTNKFIELLKEK